MPRITPTIATLKKLFALSGNKCAFDFNGENCQNEIVNKDNIVVGQVCHIEAANTTGKRHNRTTSDEQKSSFENLILLCANHHIVVDNDDRFTVDVLQNMKLSHEASYRNSTPFISEAILNKALNRLSSDLFFFDSIRHNTNLPEVIIDKLLKELDGKDIDLTNKEKIYYELEEKYNKLLGSISSTKDVNKDIYDFVTNGEFEAASTIMENELTKNLEAIENRRKESASRAFQIALLAELQLNNFKALRFLEKAADLDSENVEYLNLLGQKYVVLSQFSKAINTFETALKKYDQLNIDDTNLAAGLNNNLGLAFIRVGDLSNAYIKLRASYSMLNDNEYKDKAGILNNIGLMFKENRNYIEALQHYRMALDLVEKSELEDDKMLYGTIANNVCSVCIILRELVAAQRWSDISLQTFLSCIPEMHPKLAVVYYQRSHLFYHLDKIDEAFKYLFMALEIYISSVGETHADVGGCYNDLGILYQDVGDLEKSVYYYNKAIELYTQLLGESHPYTKLAKQNLKKLNNNL